MNQHNNKFNIEPLADGKCRGGIIMGQTNDLKSRIDMDTLRKNIRDFEVNYNAKTDMLLLQQKDPPRYFSGL